ncbi:MAG: hypothetical protein ABR572_05990 [Cryomorphaceae bacterium]
MRTTSLLFAFLAAAVCSGQTNTTPEYAEVIAAYTAIAKSNAKTARLTETGITDAGLPLHTLVIDPAGRFDPKRSRDKGDLVCLIMNGIHPGEPCGIDAALDFAEKAAQNPKDGVVYVIIPIYNIGGALNRSGVLRANQNGPEEYGFRGNAKNYDLNRDFIKSDARNTFAFAEVFHTWQPHIFLDTHTSNGADYQPNLSLISTFPERLHPMQAGVLTRELLPALYSAMVAAGEPMVPYVNTRKGTPESGINAFTDLPRYGTGYAAMWGTIGFITEAHMLKPYGKRVAATRTFMHVLDSLIHPNRDKIVALKKVAERGAAEARTFTTRWSLGDEADSVTFAGYRADSIRSEVTGQMRIRYNRDRPYTEKTAHYNTHLPEGEYELPAAFIIPQGYTEIADRLRANGIRMRTLTADSTAEVTATYITDFETVDAPYEGHYLHYNTKTRTRKVPLEFRKGDIVVLCNQPGNRYLAHVFDPASDDSFFNWNFFDGVLMQKEYFSGYLFEDTAAEILRRNTMLSKKFEEKKKSDPDFAGDAGAQLDFIYKNSKYYEPTHMRLPVFRVEN